MTEQAFQEAVWQKVESENLSFILAVYQTLDEFLEQEIKNSEIVLVCKKGCSSCCYQLITCTEMEIDEIVRFIEKIPRPTRRPLKRRLEKFARKWQSYYQRNKPILKRNSFQAHKDWGGQPCPFLNKNKGFCEIYPARIIDCRTLTSLTNCSTDLSGAKRFRFKFEIWDNNMILNEQKKRMGIVTVTPIHHWLLVKNFK